MGDTPENLVNVFGEKGERMSGGTNAPTWHPGEGVDDGTIISQVKEICHMFASRVSLMLTPKGSKSPA